MANLICETTLVSLGETAKQLGASLERIVDAATMLGIHAAERRDGIPWFRGEHVEAIRKHLAANK